MTAAKEDGPELVIHTCIYVFESKLGGADRLTYRQLFRQTLPASLYHLFVHGSDGWLLSDPNA